jgi:hypothetical protein
MNRWAVLMALGAVGLGATAGVAAEPAIPLHVLYVGAATGPRAGHFEKFLKEHFARVTIADAKAFDPASARAADVVLFDWSQSDGDLQKGPVPLGRFEDWSKPTVLLNSAGLLVAGHWQIIGGAG